MNSQNIRSLIIFTAFLILISCSESTDSDMLIKIWMDKGASEELNITYPRDNTLFPPEIIPPTFIWEDNNDANNWLAFIEDSNEIIHVSGFLKKKQWKPDSVDWENIKLKSLEKNLKVTILGFNRKRGKEEIDEIISSAFVNIRTSKDSVEAPIFYRTVTLPFSYAVDHLETISWRLGDISSNHEPNVVLENLPVCGNCHSFSLDGKTIAMDTDYGNDKGSYFISPIQKNIIMEFDNIITWSDYKREDKENTFGLLSQISPDGRYALSTVKDRSIFVRKPDLHYSQLFFPIKGIIGVYDTKTKKFSSLPGADDPEYCQSNPSWNSNEKEILFTKAPYFRMTDAEKSKDVVLPASLAKDFIEGKQDYKYDLYRIQFNEGKGGEAVSVQGASNNGKSNYFAKYSPDGKWIVFTQAKNFMLLQPDAILYIMPSDGGEPREMNCNNPNTMNSWHSWSPNGKWLVFASKARGPYTQLYLTHIDENGIDTPPVYLEKLSVKNLAANIPEFVNIKPDGITKIIENFMDNDNYSFIRGKNKFDLGDLDGALADINESIKIEPDEPVLFNMRALIKVEKGDYDDAIEDFTKVIELLPDKFDAYANRAAAKFNLNDFKGAIEDLNKTIQLNPKGSRGYFSRGTAKYNTGDYSGAIEDYTKCIKLNPKNNNAWFKRGISKLQIEMIDSACEDLKKAEELGNENARHYVLEYCGEK
ncbi:tetratricopeptide repeat protein [Bacteroidota bacterium]